MKRLISLFVILVLAIYSVGGQSKVHLQDINKTWSKFCKAFETLDYTLMEEIHSKDLVRISGGRKILDYNTYINNYKRQFAAMKQSNQTNSIALRFFERVANDSVASERGVYKLTRNPNTEKEQRYYGQFHVVMKKIDNQWVITMDYDSSESNTIDKTDYNKAYTIDDLEKFLN